MGAQIYHGCRTPALPRDAARLARASVCGVCHRHRHWGSAEPADVDSSAVQGRDRAKACECSAQRQLRETAAVSPPNVRSSHPARACLRAVRGRWVSQWAVLTLSLLSHTQSGIQVCFCSLSRFVAQHEPLLLPDNSCCQTQRSKNHAHAAAENMIRQFTLTLPMLLNTVTE